MASGCHSGDDMSIIWLDTDTINWTDTDDVIWTDWYFIPVIVEFEALEPKYLIYAKDEKYGLKDVGLRYQFATTEIQKIEKDSKQNIWAFAWDAHTGGDVTISSVTFKVFDADDASVQASDTATIVDNATATPDFYGLVDSTDAAFVVGSSYYVRFTITVTPEVMFYDVWFEII